MEFCQPGSYEFAKQRGSWSSRCRVPELDGSLNILSGISSRPLSVAMIATGLATDHNPLVCDLACVVGVVVGLSEGGPWSCPAR